MRVKFYACLLYTSDMADESNIILNMPFDEAAGSTIAYDYSKTRADGTVVEADFTGGKMCIRDRYKRGFFGRAGCGRTVCRGK